MTLTLAYEHYSNTLEPRPLNAAAVWDIAYMARRYICTNPMRPKLQIEAIIARSRRLRINGQSFQTKWDLRQGLTDDLGRPIFGVAEFDAEVPRNVMIAVDASGNGRGEPMVRSTAAHELGHAIFDGPGWVREGDKLGSSAPDHRLERTQHKPKAKHKHVQWVEWRADEFMGAFLAPRALLHNHVLKLAAALGIPLTESTTGHGLPVILGPDADPDALDHLTLDLGELFGLTPAFVYYRMRAFDLIVERGVRS